MTNSMPTIFLGHGNPMNALATNAYTAAWQRIGIETPKPKAVLGISAHWYGSGTAVTAAKAPKTIHDFGGFPEPLYQVQYPAPGDPELAQYIQNLLRPLDVELDQARGLDHGIWGVFCHLYPAANVPIIQLRIDRSQPPAFHYELGRRLSSLRAEGVLIAGSGNIVHNLHTYDWGGQQRIFYDWAGSFEDKVKNGILSRDHGPLVDYLSLGQDAMLSAPTPEHYLPLLYILGAAQPDDRITFPVEGFEGGSISMLAVQFG
jgi:4,5-DOPA dioxygenase extradiol